MAANKESQEKKQSSGKENSEASSSNKATAEKSNQKSDFDANSEMEQLVSALDNNITEIEIEDAIHLIDEWHSFLTKTKEADVKELAGELKELQKMLKGGKATGHEISEQLIHIGEQTAEFSSDAEKGSKQAVQKLGKQLRKAGTSIAKAEDQEYHEQLDSLMEKAEGNELTSMDADAAVGAIDVWYNLLHKAEGEQFQSVANSLKELKTALKRNNAKPETIAKALSHVAEQTNTLADATPRGFKGAVKKLGKQLTQAAESISSSQEETEK